MVGLAAVVVPLFFAGSAGRLADGTRIAGIDVGGLSPADATTLLQRRSDRLARVPVTFVAGTERFEITPRALGVQVDWRSAVATAERAGSGFGVVRGYRRLELQLFPQNLVPSIHTYDAALDYELSLLAKKLEVRHREAQLVRRGLHITIAPGSTGRFLDRAAARQLLVRSLASFSRTPVRLPVRIDAPQITVATLTAKQRRASRIISAPVTMVAGETRLRMPRWRLATLLDLDTLRFSGKNAERYFTQLEGTVDRPPKDAAFAVSDSQRV